MVNTLTYYNTATITVLKSFIVQAQTNVKDAKANKNTENTDNIEMLLIFSFKQAENTDRAILNVRMSSSLILDIYE
jgi:hypothetical protein